MRRRKPKTKASYRYFFATDIHGSDRCFRKFLAAATVYGADALILGGDIAGKAVVPIIKVGADRYRVRFQGANAEVPVTELIAVEDRIKFNGLYPHVCELEEYERLVAEPEYQRSLFRQLIITQIGNWRVLAADRLPDTVRCIITPGNDDPRDIDPVLEERGKVECPEGAVVAVGPMLLASLGDTNRTPWDTEREFEESELARRIDQMVAPYATQGPLLFNFHCPPYASGLDTVIALDEQCAPVIKRGTPVEVPVGSSAVRAAIEQYKPKVGLHGHIHESHGIRRIGSCMCVNPGSDYASGVLKGALVDVTADGEYVGHLLTSG